MDRYISTFKNETGCRLVVERGPNGVCFRAINQADECIGTRYLSTSLLSNVSLVKAVMSDFIMQTNARKLTYTNLHET